MWASKKPTNRCCVLISQRSKLTWVKINNSITVLLISYELLIKSFFFFNCGKKNLNEFFKCNSSFSSLSVRIGLFQKKYCTAPRDRFFFEVDPSRIPTTFTLPPWNFPLEIHVFSSIFGLPPLGFQQLYTPGVFHWYPQQKATIIFWKSCTPSCQNIMLWPCYEP